MAKDVVRKDVRKCSGCVVFRKNDYVLEVLLVTAGSKRHEWVLPKGGVEPDLNSKDSASKEVYEEAGVVGQIRAELGSYRFMKPSTGQQQRVKMYSMEYQGDADDWPEAEKRDRQWFNAEVAMKIVNPYLAPFIADVIQLHN